MRINLYHIYGEWQHQWVGLASQSEWNNMEAWATNQTNIMAKLDGVRNKYLLMEYRYYTEAADPAFDVYFDNLAVYPQYKITYVLADGTEVYDYALFDADGKTFLTEYTPKASPGIAERRLFVGFCFLFFGHFGHNDVVEKETDTVFIDRIGIEGEPIV